MPARLFPHRDWSNQSAEQQLPFTGDSVNDAEFAHGQNNTDVESQTHPRARRIRAQSNASATLSQSFTRNPIRSFAHQTSHGFTDTPQYSSQGVRERSAQLASYALDSEEYQDRPHRQSFAESGSPVRRPLSEYTDGRASIDSTREDTIEEDSDEIETPVTVIGGPQQAADQGFFSWQNTGRKGSDASRVPEVVVQDTERTPLLPTPRLPRAGSQPEQKKSKGKSKSRSRSPGKSLPLRVKKSFANGREHVRGLTRTLTNPKTYTKDAVLSGALNSAQTLTAVFLGLLLNILDALSYGYILFPLGAPIFSSTGPDGISIFFVSCIVSQLCYSFGLSAFRGGVGSEMIEVVPFFHKMAYSIMERMEGESPEAIMATTITSYCLSSILTGLIFLALGGFKLGTLVSFFPRHILIGCIGGVGFFLFVTGIEVSARIEGNLNYDLATLQKLFSADTWFLWTIPLVLAISIMLMQRMVKSPFVLPAFFVLIFATFYLFVKGIFRVDLEDARNAGWIFEQPEAGVKFYRFYSYFSEYMIDY
jgi:SulP family sulfate permease